MKYVLDASIAVKWILPEDGSTKALELREVYCQRRIELVSPDTFPTEVAHALTRAERRRVIEQGEARVGIAGLFTTAPRLESSCSLLVRAVEISSHYRISVYDCLYVALAEAERCELLTADARLYEALRDRFAIQLLASLQLPS